MQLLCFNPQIDELGLNEFLLNTFINAKKAIKIVTPYFCPSKEINNCLIFLFKKGIKIEIVVPSKNAHFIKIMNQHCYKNLVDLGIKIYEYDGFIHSKLILIDQEYALIGSCNLDYRSIYFDFESELIVIDNEFILQATKIFTQYKDNSTLIEKKNLKQKERICKKLLIKTMSLGKTLF